jgi:hypothetical protein
MRFLAYLPLAVCVLVLSGCGSGVTPTAATTPPTTLTGNWFLAGARTPVSYPVLSTTLFVNGTSITGGGNVQIQCAPNALIGGSVDFSGQIAQDGTFQASSPLIGGTPGGYQITLTGTSPTPSAPTTWTGSYTISATLNSLNGTLQCSYNHNATFVAQTIPHVAGTYAGPAANGLFNVGSLGKNAGVSMQIAQGAPLLVTYGSISGYRVPLTGTITVTGSACFNSGSTATALQPSELTGDHFELFFTMDDGSQLVLLGNMTDLTEAQMAVTLITQNGNCPNVTTQTTLTHQ